MISRVSDDYSSIVLMTSVIDFYALKAGSQAI